jgi:hypothetical protein
MVEYPSLVSLQDQEILKKILSESVSRWDFFMWRLSLALIFVPKPKLIKYGLQSCRQERVQFLLLLLSANGFVSQELLMVAFPPRAFFVHWAP